MREVWEVLHREFVYLWYYFDIQLRQIFGYWVLGMVHRFRHIRFCSKTKFITAVWISFRDAFRGIGSDPGQPSWVLLRPFVCTAPFPLRLPFPAAGCADDWLAAFMMSSILLESAADSIQRAHWERTSIARHSDHFLLPVRNGCRAGWWVFFIRTARSLTSRDFRRPKEP